MKQGSDVNISREVCNTSLKGTDNTHVFSTQIQEGICVWWQLHQLSGRILEHQVFGGCVFFRGEEVKTLQKHTAVVNQSFHTCWKGLFGVHYCVSYPDCGESGID